MTHTLHRQGTEENLSNDYVVLCMAAKGINEDGAAEKMRRFLGICLRHNPVNLGDMKTGNMYSVGADQVVAGVTSSSIVHGLFTDPGTVSRVLQEIKEANLGMSVVVSCLFRSARDCCRQAGLSVHTVEHSLGIWGRRERLPSPKVLEITTMCGHGMVASHLVSSLVEDIRVGRTGVQDASLELTRQCVCGVFNPERCSQLLKAVAAIPVKAKGAEVPA